MWFVLLVAGGGLLWWLLSERPKGVFALWAKRYDDGWEVYILSHYRKGDDDSDELDEVLQTGSESKPSGNKETASAYERWEYVALNKVEERVYHGFLGSRFSLHDKEAVCDVIHELLNLPEDRWGGPKKGILRDTLRFLTITRRTDTYIPLESLERLKNHVQLWIS